MASKRNSSGAASAPLSHYDDRGVRERWPVLVYRLQSHRGWEVYADPDKEATTTIVPPPRHRHPARKPMLPPINPRRAAITAVPPTPIVSATMPLRPEIPAQWKS